MDRETGTSVLSRCPDLPRHRWTVDDYHRMAEVGLLDADARVELIEGEIVETASVGDPHIDASIRLTRGGGVRHDVAARPWGQASALCQRRDRGVLDREPGR